MTHPCSGEGDRGPGGTTPGPSSFPPPSPLTGDRSSALPPLSPAGDRPSALPPSPLAGDRSSALPPSPLTGDRSASAFCGDPCSASPSSRLCRDGSALPAELLGAARKVFGDRLQMAEEYAELLVTDGAVRGLIGPREAPRIWERHLINCGVISEIIPLGASVIDVGSGAGLPGIVLAVARPDLTITLVEPLARRTAFLSEAVTMLGLDTTVTVVRGRAEDIPGGPPAAADVVTARAVAPLNRLAGWCLPLAAIGGRVLALKGSAAAEEMAEHRDAIARLGGSNPAIALCGAGVIDPPTTVVEIVHERNVVTPQPRPSKRAAGSERGAGRSGERRSGRGRTRRG